VWGKSNKFTLVYYTRVPQINDAVAGGIVVI